MKAHDEGIKQLIKQLYIHNKRPLKTLAKEYDIPYRTITSWSRVEKWSHARAQADLDTHTEHFKMVREYIEKSGEFDRSQVYLDTNRMALDVLTAEMTTLIARMGRGERGLAEEAETIVKTMERVFKIDATMKAVIGADEKNVKKDGFYD